MRRRRKLSFITYSDCLDLESSSHEKPSFRINERSFFFFFSSSKPYRKFKSTLIPLTIINNGGNKLFLMCKSTSSEGSTAKNSKKRDNI